VFGHYAEGIMFSSCPSVCACKRRSFLWPAYWIYTDYRDGVFSYLTAREQALCRRRAKVERLLAWKQKLDAEEREIERLEKEAVHGGVASGRASSANDSTVSG